MNTSSTPFTHSIIVALIIAVVIIVLAVIFRAPISDYFAKPTPIPTPSPTLSPTPTPTPSPIPTPVPSPMPVTSSAPAPQPVKTSCSPATQTVTTGGYVVLSSNDPSARWTAPGAAPPYGFGAKFTTRYDTPGSKVVTATGAFGAGACRVSVEAH